MTKSHRWTFSYVIINECAQNDEHSPAKCNKRRDNIDIWAQQFIITVVTWECFIRNFQDTNMGHEAEGLVEHGVVWKFRMKHDMLQLYCEMAARMTKSISFKSYFCHDYWKKLILLENLVSGGWKKRISHLVREPILLIACKITIFVLTSSHLYGNTANKLRTSLK